jgi:CheY-like chemotaxis protein
MLDLLRRTLGEAIEVKTSVAAKPCQAFVDPGELEHALLNLAVNAKDAMPGGGTISIKIAGKTLSGSDLPAGADIAPGAYVVLTVSDTGTGIAKQHLSQIFEPFFTTKEVGKGTGLGLSMVYGFAKQSGGQVIVDSEPGGGTSFHLYLPGAEAAAKADEPAGAEDPLDALSTGRATILVVEDEEAVRDFAVSVLEAHGYRIIEAEDGLQALAILRGRDDIDLLFTDMVMPGGMSGWDLAAEAARLHPGLKVLFTSGYSSEMADSACAAERGADLIRKPYDDNEVVRGVATALVA